jgi:hypothetical protein
MLRSRRAASGPAMEPCGSRPPDVRRARTSAKAREPSMAGKGKDKGKKDKKGKGKDKDK